MIIVIAGAQISVQTPDSVKVTTTLPAESSARDPVFVERK